MTFCYLHVSYGRVMRIFESCINERKQWIIRKKTSVRMNEIFPMSFVIDNHSFTCTT